MVIKPADITTNTNAAVKAQADRIEHQLDDSLRVLVDFTGSHTMRLLNEVGNLVKAELERRYVKEGPWAEMTFQFVGGDQRDQDPGYYTVTVSTTRSHRGLDDRR